MSYCVCSHDEIAHETNLVCTMRGCSCTQYQVVLSRAGSLRQDKNGGVHRLAADEAQRRNHQHQYQQRVLLGGDW